MSPIGPLLPDDAGKLDVTIVEGSRWGGPDGPVFHHCVLGSTLVTDEHVPFDAGTIAYATFRYAIGGEALILLGPAVDDLDGTLEVDAAGGIITPDLLPLESIGLEFPRQAKGVWDLVVYHGGDPERAKGFLYGDVVYRRRSTERPAAP